MASSLRKLGAIGIGLIFLFSLGIALMTHAAPMGTHDGMQTNGIGCPYAQDGEGMCPSAPLHLALLANETAREIPPEIVPLVPVALLLLLLLPAHRIVNVRWREIFNRNALLKSINRFLLAFARGLLKPKRPAAVIA